MSSEVEIEEDALRFGQLKTQTCTRKKDEVVRFDCLTHSSLTATRKAQLVTAWVRYTVGVTLSVSPVHKKNQQTFNCLVITSLTWISHPSSIQVIINYTFFRTHSNFGAGILICIFIPICDNDFFYFILIGSTKRCNFSSLISLVVVVFLSSCLSSVMVLLCHCSSGLLCRSQLITFWQCSFMKPKCALPSSSKSCHVPYLHSRTLASQQCSEAPTQSPSPEPNYRSPPLTNLPFVTEGGAVISSAYSIFSAQRELDRIMRQLWNAWNYEVAFCLDLHNSCPS